MEMCKFKINRNVNILDLSVESKLKTLPKVQYELPAESEEFLREGLKLIDAPRESLDLCTHRVVRTLTKDCNKLNLEEVGKLAVMMLNCQLEIEGRETFSCKPEMVRRCESTEFLIFNRFSPVVRAVHSGYGFSDASSLQLHDSPSCWDLLGHQDQSVPGDV
jgi:hypothetical protein